MHFHFECTFGTMGKILEDNQENEQNLKKDIADKPVIRKIWLALLVWYQPFFLWVSAWVICGATWWVAS